MISIWSISDSDKHFSDAILEYTKRLWKDIQIINYKTSKKDNQAQIIQEDTEMIIEKVESAKKAKNAYVILLSKDGKSLDTDQRRYMIELKRIQSQDIIFLIGWPYGFDEEKLGTLVDLKLSFGAVTMPHGLVKLVVLEQIYRCLQIIGGRQYHY